MCSKANNRYVFQLLINILWEKIIVFCSSLQFSNVDRILIYLYTADYKDKNCYSLSVMKFRTNVKFLSRRRQ